MRLMASITDELTDFCFGKFDLPDSICGSPDWKTWQSSRAGRFTPIPESCWGHYGGTKIVSIRGNIYVFLLCLKESKLCVIALVSVDELFSVENAHFAPLQDLDKYSCKIMVSGLMES